MTSTTSHRSLVTATPAAAPDRAEAHFGDLLAFETDCWDVHEEVLARRVGTGDLDGSPVVVLDVRSPEAFAAGHVPGSVNLPHRAIDAEAVARWGAATTFVTYCAGAHCNAADRAALRLARLGRPVKKMLGGVEGWKAEGFPLETS